MTQSSSGRQAAGNGALTRIWRDGRKEKNYPELKTGKTEAEAHERWRLAGGTHSKEKGC